MDQPKDVLKKLAARYRKVVVWGLKRQYHTHRYIHQSFYRTLKKLGVPAVWTDFNPRQAGVIEAGDFVLSADPKGRFVNGHNLPVKKNVFYCLHNFSADIARQIDPKFLLHLQVYTNFAETADQKWDEVTFFNSQTRTLYQPWGTNLLSEEFRQPAFNNHKRVFWIGSVWNNGLNQGNINEIAELKRALGKKKLKFSPVRFVPDWLNIFLIRYSRLAPAVAGRWQAENNYLPCRMFKNISYGQLGFSNVKKFGDLFKGCNLNEPTTEELVDKALRLSQPDYLALIAEQQKIVRGHTYVQKLSNIFRAAEIISR